MLSKKKQAEHFHKGITCNHDPLTNHKVTAFPNSCNTKSPTPPTAVLTAVMVALSSLLWAAARSFRCWLLLFIAVLSSSAVCLAVSQTAQNQKAKPNSSEFSFCENNLDCLLVVQQPFMVREWWFIAEGWSVQLSKRLIDLCTPVRCYCSSASDYISCTQCVCLLSLQPPSAHHGTFASPCSSDASICITPFPFAIYSESDFCAHPEKTNRLLDLCQIAHPMHRFASPLFHHYYLFTIRFFS